MLRLESATQGYKEKAVLAKNLYFPPEEEKKEGAGEEQKEDVAMAELVDDDAQLYDFTRQVNLQAAVLTDLKALAQIANGQEKKVNLKMVLVEDPPTQFLIKARVSLFNQLIFEAIQELQKPHRTFTNEQIYARVSKYEDQLNELVDTAFRIRDRELKTEVIQELQDCKEKTAAIMSVLRNTTGNISNA